jgi:hypothetical protein
MQWHWRVLTITIYVPCSADFLTPLLVVVLRVRCCPVNLQAGRWQQQHDRAGTLSNQQSCVQQ